LRIRLTRSRDKIAQFFLLGNGFLFRVGGKQNTTDKQPLTVLKIKTQKVLKYPCLLADFSVEYVIGTAI